MKILQVLTGMSLLFSSKLISADRFLNQPLSTIKNKAALTKFEKLILVDSRDGLINNVELLFDLFVDLVTLTKEDKTKFFIFFISDLECRQRIYHHCQEEQTSLIDMVPDGNSQKFLLDWIDPGLLKEFLIPLATSLNLDGRIVENYINEERYVECFAYLLFI
jgi:hypothetical protein